MKHKNTVSVPTTDALILKAFRRVVEKKAPAHNKDKKSEADCLIVESIISYFSAIDDKKKVFFITDNKSDFANPDKPEEVHHDLLPSFRALDINYAPHLAKILKEQFGQEIDEEDIKFEQDLPLRGFSHGFGSGFASSFSTRTSMMGEATSIAVVPAPNSLYTDQTPSWPGHCEEGF